MSSVDQLSVVAEGRDLARYAATYQTLPFEQLQVQFRRRLVLEVLGRFENARVLEVGCGLEPLVLHAPRHATWTIVEPAPAFAAEARRISAGMKRVEVVEQTLEGAVNAGALPVGAYDVVLLSSLLHEVPDPEALLRSVRTLCTPSALVHCNVPNATSFHRELAVAMGLIASVHQSSSQQLQLQQPRIFDADSLSALVSAAGFTVDERGGYFVKPFTHAQMQALMTGGTIDRSILDGLYQLGKKYPMLASEIFVNASRR